MLYMGNTQIPSSATFQQLNAEADLFSGQAYHLGFQIYCTYIMIKVNCFNNPKDGKLRLPTLTRVEKIFKKMKQEEKDCCI